MRFLCMSLFYLIVREVSVSVFEIVLLGVALAMDAVAVSLTNGMSEPRMKPKKIFETAGAFGLFQFFMPLLGYCVSGVFAKFVTAVAPVLSFAILAFLGGKMIFGCVRELLAKRKPLVKKEKGSETLKLLIEALATSIDALAVGVTLLALETQGALALAPVYSALVIGAVTFALSFAAVLIGKRAGAAIADKAEILGGVVLVFIGLKILLESV